MKNELTSLRNRANKMEERISNIKGRNLEMTQMEKVRDLRVKINKEIKNSTRTI